MKAVLISIQPKWCEQIASGKKTIEVRKTHPKIDTPFKCYIYCTADRRKHIADTFVPQTPLFVKNGMAKSSIGREDGLPWKLGNGKVIGEFVCDSIIVARCGSYCKIPTKLSQIDAIDLLDYANDKPVYGWHISNLVIYDKPKSIVELCKPCDRDPQCDCNHCKRHGGGKPVLRAPQSWCYVEELQ